MHKIEDYERNQSFNPVVSWLHSFRYRHAARVLSQLGASRIRVLDIGCAYAKTYSVLDGLFDIDYTGIEIQEHFVRMARGRYGDRPNFSVVQDDALTAIERFQPDVVISFETLEHFKSRDAVRMVEKIAAVRPKLFLCSVPIDIGPAVWLKNVGSALCGYGRHAEYTWAETFWAGLHQFDKIRPHAQGHRGFDWRWLAQTIRNNMRIKHIDKFPFSFLPAAISTSVFITAEPR